MNRFHLVCVALGFFQAQLEELLLWLPSLPLAMLLYKSIKELARVSHFSEQRYPALLCDGVGVGRWQSSRGQGTNNLCECAQHSGQESSSKCFVFFVCLLLV